MKLYPIRLASILAAVFFVASCTTVPTARAPQSDPSESGAASAELQEILRPFVADLDRDLWTFRYERREIFHPTSHADVEQHLAVWAKRFYDVQIRSGADTGPGVYVAMDPVATATWGGTDPSLFAIKLKTGERMLIGDQLSVPANTLAKLKDLAHRLDCGRSSTEMNDIGHAVGYFRMNPNPVCRESIIKALGGLGVKALSYGFYSADFDGCRATGTAISIIDPSAIALDEINYFTGGGHIEGRPDATPFIKAVFGEVQSNFSAQSLLASPETRKNFQRQFAFFNHVSAPDQTSYQAWRSEHIFKCGKPWATEGKNPRWILMAHLKRFMDPDAAEAIIEMDVQYRARFEASRTVPEIAQARIGAEMRIESLRAVVDAEFRHSGLPPAKFEDWKRWRDGDAAAAEKIHEKPLNRDTSEKLQAFLTTANPKDPQLLWQATSALQSSPLAAKTFYNLGVYNTGIVPLWSGDPKQDRTEYDQILRRCAHLYMDPKIPMEKIVFGECGMY
jgi:hypothetical protein